MAILSQIWKWFSLLTYVAFSPDVRKVVHTIKEKISESPKEDRKEVTKKICEGVACSADLKRD